MKALAQLAKTAVAGAATMLVVAAVVAALLYLGAYLDAHTFGAS